jgi:hypothetical protein
MRKHWLMIVVLVTLAAALVVTVMADDGVPYAKPGSSLCCPNGAVPLCWCAPDVRSVPPCEPPAVLGMVPGMSSLTCLVY